MIKLFEQFNNEQEIYDICKEYNIQNYTINDDGSIDVNFDINLRNRELTRLPLKFNKVNGYFDCSSNKLTTLEGCPKYISLDFICYDNQLTSLDECPSYIGGGFYLHSNQITTLEGCPKSIDGEFCFSDNKLTSLKGCPNYIGSDFDCSDNPIDKIDVEIDIEGDIFLDSTKLNPKIILLDHNYIKMLFKHGLDYNIFNDDGSINNKQLEHFLNDFKE